MACDMSVDELLFIKWMTCFSANVCLMFLYHLRQGRTEGNRRKEAFLGVGEVAVVGVWQGMEVRGSDFLNNYSPVS